MGRQRMGERLQVLQRQPEVPAWHGMTASQVGVTLEVTPASGLTAAEVERRLATSGPNRLRAERRESLVEEIVEELREPMILFLLATGVVYAAVGGLTDALTSFAIILVVLGVEIFNERRAQTALAGLRQLAEPTALVRRDEVPREVPVQQLVPGDLPLPPQGQPRSPGGRPPPRARAPPALPPPPPPPRP